jgi:TetR/AcrR family transcriptional regulator, transcriptional repressor for nem operon
MKASHRKRSILASAAPIFNRRGFAGTSIAEILAATALEKGGLYNHFSSKEELAVAAFEYAFGEVESYFVKALSDLESGLARLHAYVDAFERYVTDPVVEGGCPIANATLEADDALPFLRDAVQKAFHRMRDPLVHNLMRAIEKRQLRPVDAEATADFILSALQGSLLLSRGMRSSEHVRRVAATLHAWLDGAS